MRLSDALRVQPGESISFSGSGGKTTALIHLSSELKNPVIATTTTHFSKDQIGFADHQVISAEIGNPKNFIDSISSGVTLIIGEELQDSRISGPPLDLLKEIYQYAQHSGINMLIETDGSRQRPLKAPGFHEPVIPEFIDHAVVVAGLSALGKPFSGRFVHRVENYQEIAEIDTGEQITIEAIQKVLIDERGGLKGIPEKARRVCFLNQADDDNLKARGKRIASFLKNSYNSVVVASLINRSTDLGQSTPDPTLNGYTVHSVYEPVTGIVLAAGESKRLGKPKQLLPWQGTSLINHIVSTALGADLDYLIVVVGAYEDQVRKELNDLQVKIVVNPNWKSGQSGSVKKGLSAVPEVSGSVIFFLVDQPNVDQTLIRSIIEKHAETLSSIVAPLVQGQRGNPVLFDRRTFKDFQTLAGDTGGRQLFSRFQVSWLEWHDESALADIDTDEDYQLLLAKFG